jgi:hypothetical protein
MTEIDIYLETGKKKVFASALAWPGWSRSGKDEDQALETFLDYAPRYARVLNHSELEFPSPIARSQFSIVERHPGNSTTDFGAPSIIPAADQGPFDSQDFDFSQKILAAVWWAFDQALRISEGKELKKGPRGGGRDAERIISHVFEGDRGYLSRIAGKFKAEKDRPPAEQMGDLRQAIIEALHIAAVEGLPEKGPRGGKIWPARYFVRRAAWHTLDHAWEIEDRIM